MHDGEKGEEHVYSYINHEDVWWKVVDFTVTEVRLDFRWPPTQIEPTNQSCLQVALETVLSDENGMDFGTGPFFLIYSRSLSDFPNPWDCLSFFRENACDPNSVPSGSKPRTPTEGS